MFQVKQLSSIYEAVNKILEFISSNNVITISINSIVLLLATYILYLYLYFYL